MLGALGGALSAVSASLGAATPLKSVLPLDRVVDALKHAEAPDAVSSKRSLQQLALLCSCSYVRFGLNFVLCVFRIEISCIIRRKRYEPIVFHLFVNTRNSKY